MAIGFNPALEMSQLRTQQTLAMTAPGTPAAVAPGAPAAAAAAAAAPGAAGDAAMGAVGVMEPPSTSKIILGSVLKGAVTGASVSLGLKQFGPMLMGIGPIGRVVGSLPVANKAGELAGKGLLGFLGRLPILQTVLPKALGLFAKSGIGGFLIAGLIGAAVGGVIGGISGMKQAKQANGDYQKALAEQQAAQQPPAAEPPAGPPAGNAPANPPQTSKPGKGGRKVKTWVIARQGSTFGANKFGSYTVKSGDTLAKLAKRFHTTEAEIRKLNPGGVDAGTTIKLKRKVVPDAKAWVA